MADQKTLCARLGYEFKNPMLLEQALTHRKKRKSQ